MLMYAMTYITNYFYLHSLNGNASTAMLVNNFAPTNILRVALEMRALPFGPGNGHLNSSTSFI